MEHGIAARPNLIYFGRALSAISKDQLLRRWCCEKIPAPAGQKCSRSSCESLGTTAHVLIFESGKTGRAALDCPSCLRPLPQSHNVIAVPGAFFKLTFTVCAVASILILHRQAFGSGQRFSRIVLCDFHPHSLAHLRCPLSFVRQLLGWVQT